MAEVWRRIVECPVPGCIWSLNADPSQSEAEERRDLECFQAHYARTHGQPYPIVTMRLEATHG